jgi:PPM family protein phosphatase
LNWFSSDQERLEAWVWGATHPGQVRSENQDAFLIAEIPDGAENPGFLLGPDSGLDPQGPEGLLRVGPRGLLFLVADGMGGAAGGATASRLASTTIAERLLRDWTQDRWVTPARFAFHLREAVREANGQVWNRANAQPELTGMGTTATVAGILDGTVYLAQIGDSRAYLIRDGRATQLTRDQSMVQELIDRGALTREEAERSAHRSVLLQALGTQPEVSIPLTFHPLEKGDQLLLCSDGLSGPVRDDEIAQLASEEGSPAEACARLLALANTRGGPDNITAVLVRVVENGFPRTLADAEPRLRPFDLDLG